MKKRKAPQEKKALSYQRDCRNVYGERGSHSRHAIARQKAINRRTDRHKANQVLRTLSEHTLDAWERAELKVKTIRQRDWRKYPDCPLGEVVKRKLWRRGLLELAE